MKLKYYFSKDFQTSDNHELETLRTHYYRSLKDKAIETIVNNILSRSSEFASVWGVYSLDDCNEENNYLGMQYHAIVNGDDNSVTDTGKYVIALYRVEPNAIFMQLSNDTISGLSYAESGVFARSGRTVYSAVSYPSATIANGIVENSMYATTFAKMKAEPLYFRCPYQANIIKTFASVSKITGIAYFIYFVLIIAMARYLYISGIARLS
jgi:hypothetical protein